MNNNKSNIFIKITNFIIPVILMFILIILSFIINKQENNNEIEFSHKSGFYSDEFDLTIKGKGDIYYTLDGSIPTENSIKYTGPIHISDASKNPNTISMRDDFAICKNKILIKQFALEYTCKEYQKPKINIDKSTIIRAVRILPNKTKSEVKSASYFVNYDSKYGYDNINVISIITDPKNLFDPEYGIYVNGKKFDDYIRQTNVHKIDINKIHDMLNYLKKGRQSERPAYIAFFNKDKKLISEQNIGIRVRGYHSRSFFFKPLNLYAREEYDKKNRFEKTLLNTNYSPKKLTLFTGSQDYTKWRDYIIQSLLRNNKNVSTLKFKPYVLFLNGEYWGFYWLTEAYDKYYISHYFNINDISKIVEIKDEKIEIGDNNDLEEYKEAIQYIISLDLTKNDNYEQVKKIIDIDSLMYQYGINLYVKNFDFSLTHNNVMWKIKEKNNSLKLDDNKWHFMLYDFNSSVPFLSFIPFNRIDEDCLFHHLMTNSEFRHKLSETIIKLSLNEFEPNRVIGFIEQNQNTIDMAMLKHIERNSGDEKNKRYEHYKNTVNKIKDFYRNRPQKIYEQYCKELDYDKLSDKQVKQVCMNYD